MTFEEYKSEQRVIDDEMQKLRQKRIELDEKFFAESGYRINDLIQRKREFCFPGITPSKVYLVGIKEERGELCAVCSWIPTKRKTITKTGMLLKLNEIEKVTDINSDTEN